MENKLIRFTKIVLDIMFFGGIVVFITLPLILKFFGKYYSDSISEHFILMLIVLGISGVFGIVIVSELRKMMRTVIEESCFVYKNVKSLNLMAFSSLCITVLFLIKVFLFPTPATCIIVLVFFIAALFSEVLAIVFAQAIRYKEENDLTI